MMNCRISVICLILVCTNLIIGCSGVRSVRDYYGNKKNTYKIKDNSLSNLNQNALDETYLTASGQITESKHNDEYQLKDESKARDYSPAQINEYDTHSKRLPTIREQMKTITDDQSLIKSDLANLKNDISDINVRLKEIALALDYLKSGKEPVAAKGSENNSLINNNENKAKSDQKESILLSDESADFKKNSATHSTHTNFNGFKKKNNKKSLNNSLSFNSNSNIEQNPSFAIKQSDIPNSKSKIYLAKHQYSSVQKLPQAMSEAMTNFEHKNYLAAIDKLKNVINKERNPTIISDCNYWIAESYFNLQKYSDALKHYQLSLNSTDKDQIIHSKFMIAETYSKIGETDKAKDVYKNVVVQYPQSDYVPHALKMLQKL